MPIETTCLEGFVGGAAGVCLWRGAGRVAVVVVYLGGGGGPLTQGQALVLSHEGAARHVTQPPMGVRLVV